MSVEEFIQKYISWIFSGAGVAVVGFLLKKIVDKKVKQEKSDTHIQELRGNNIRDVSGDGNVITGNININTYNEDRFEDEYREAFSLIKVNNEAALEKFEIKVQVKCVEGAIGAPAVQALYGNVEIGEYGLFITFGDFTKQAIDFAKAKTNLRLMDGQEFVNIILKNYEKLDSKYKAIIPLKNVYIPTQIENAY